MKFRIESTSPESCYKKLIKTYPFLKTYGYREDDGLETMRMYVTINNFKQLHELQEKLNNSEFNASVHKTFNVDLLHECITIIDSPGCITVINSPGDIKENSSTEE